MAISVPIGAHGVIRANVLTRLDDAHVRNVGLESLSSTHRGVVLKPTLQLDQKRLRAAGSDLIPWFMVVCVAESGSGAS